MRPTAGIVLLVLVSGVATGCGRKRAQIVLPPLSHFVKAVYPEGMPASQAVHYPKENTDTLIGWLLDPAWQAHWPNIVELIGYIARGKDADVDVLTGFLGRPEPGPAISYAEYGARQAVLLALGRIVFYTGNAKALAYLENSLEPGRWNDGRLDWKTPFGEGAGFMRVHFAKLGVLGAATSGVQSATDAIQDLVQHVAAPVAEDKAFRQDQHPFLQRAWERAKASQATRKSQGLATK